MSGVGERRGGVFIATKEHRRFVEFADAVHRDGYIGLCHGRTVFFTPTVAATTKQLVEDVRKQIERVNICIDQHINGGPNPKTHLDKHATLLVVDEP